MTQRRWAITAAAAGVAAAALVLVLEQVAQRRYERAFALRIAATTATYLAAVTPARRGASEYDLGRLLTNARALRTLPAWTSDVEVFHGTAPLVDATRPPLSVEELQSLRAGARVRGRVALVPLRDRTGRIVVGAVAVRPRPARRDRLPWTLPAALLAAGVAAATGLRRRPLGRYVAAAALLAVAAYADTRGAAQRSTNRWLGDTRALLQDAATRLPPARTRATFDELAAVARGGELVPGEPGESAPRRVRIDGASRAVVAVLIGPNRWAELRTTPAENSTIGWLFALTLCALAGPLAVRLTWRAEQLAARRELRPAAVAWGFLAPAGVFVIVFSVAPLLIAAYLSLHGGGPAESGGSFVGLANYVALLRDPDGTLWRSLMSTAIYALYVPVSLLLALGVALVLHRHPRGAGTARALFVVPYAASAVAAALAWRWLYHSGFGGLTVFDWLVSPRTALVGLMLVAVWSQVGGQLLLLLGGLDAIPNTYLDAARLDGAGSWRRFQRVTLPLLRPVLLLALVTGIIGAFHAFTAVRILTAGGPDGATDLVLPHLYRTGFEASRLAQASALGLLTGVLLLAFTWAQRRIVRNHA